MGSNWAQSALTAGITIIAVFVALVAVGFWLLARRKAKGQGPDAIGAKQQKANILLVRVDDAVKNAEDELGFAVAQFGEAKANDFQKVLIEAKAQLREAFSLQQKLDDAYVDTETQRRDWSARIIHLCESARTTLATQEAEFAALRQLEANAPESLAAARKLSDGVTTSEQEAQSILDELASAYSDAAISSVADNLVRAREENKKAKQAADDAEARLNESSLDSGNTTTASGLIRQSEDHVLRATQFITAISTLKGELAKASEAVTQLQATTQQNLAEARALRDAPPDADSSEAVAKAIETVEAALAAKEPLSDPLASLEILRSANAELDSSMSGARNQQRRLDGAKTALVGALVGARSQLSATRDYITTRRGGVGSEARTRLAEAERLLTIAEAEADPIAALDTARSSATYSRDADALARFDLMGR